MNSRQRRKKLRDEERARVAMGKLCQEISDQAGEIEKLRAEHTQAIQVLREELEGALSRCCEAYCISDQDNAIAMAKLLIKDKALHDAHACMILIRASMPGSKYWSEYSQTIEAIKNASGTLDNSPFLVGLLGKA